MPKEGFGTPDLNLLPEDDLLGRPGGKFLIWALSWGKKIVILTELVVVLAFLSRFWLDTTIANLSDDIDKKKAIILASSDFESKFLAVKDRIGKFNAEESIPSTVVIKKQVEGLIPVGVTITLLSVSGNSIAVAGAGDDLSLSKMVANFKGSENLGDVTIQRVTKEGSGFGVSFSLTATYLGKV